MLSLVKVPACKAGLWLPGAVQHSTTRTSSAMALASRSHQGGGILLTCRSMSVQTHTAADLKRIGADTFGLLVQRKAVRRCACCNAFTPLPLSRVMRSRSYPILPERPPCAPERYPYHGHAHMRLKNPASEHKYAAAYRMTHGLSQWAFADTPTRLNERTFVEQSACYPYGTHSEILSMIR